MDESGKKKRKYTRKTKASNKLAAETESLLETTPKVDDESQSQSLMAGGVGGDTTAGEETPAGKKLMGSRKTPIMPPSLTIPQIGSSINRSRKKSVQHLVKLLKKTKRKKRKKTSSGEEDDDDDDDSDEFEIPVNRSASKVKVNKKKEILSIF